MAGWMDGLQTSIQELLTQEQDLGTILRLSENQMPHQLRIINYRSVWKSSEGSEKRLVFSEPTLPPEIPKVICCLAAILFLLLGVLSPALACREYTAARDPETSPTHHRPADVLSVRRLR